MAEQEQPVRRKVALKIIKPGMDTRQVIARFEAERQALALMDHPNIAQVLDAGATDSGRPYFVMELVRGVPITEYCDQNRLTAAERLELFVDVCQAMQHAHQKGIIHRDIKPSNVLVTLHDGTPVRQGHRLRRGQGDGPAADREDAVHRFTQMIGTPLYMSPEQAEMSGLDIDTRSDIYSLGVLLYELLTGTTPFDRERLQAALWRDAADHPRGRAARPSTRLDHPGPARATVLGRAAGHPRRFGELLSGDLDWIVMKAIGEGPHAALRDGRRNLRPTCGGISTRSRSPPAPRRRSIDSASSPAATRPYSPPLRWYWPRCVLGTGVSIWQAIRATKARAEADSLRAEAVEFAERLKQANVLLDNARSNADGQALGGRLPAVYQGRRLQPDHYLVWSGRAALFVRLGLWKQAAADYAKALCWGHRPTTRAGGAYPRCACMPGIRSPTTRLATKRSTRSTSLPTGCSKS